MAFLYQLIALRQQYGNRTVLDISEVTIRQGGITLLRGANGAGKSSLLAILAFLTQPTAGTIIFSGTTISWREPSLATLRRRATLLHQNPYLFTGSVGANVAYGLHGQHMGREEIEELVEVGLAEVGLAGFGSRPVRGLSGGEAQRVALARSLALQPEVLLLDEPFASVDRDAADLLEDLVAALPSRGTSVIMASHDPAHVEQFIADILWLEDGRLMDWGGDPR